MQTGYFNAAWQDIKNSPGWIGKVIVLSLVMLIPIFGWIVVYGYLYGWARDIAWNVHSPLPARIFGNEDGKLYSRGFFALVIAFVCALVPGILSGLSNMMMGVGFYGLAASDYSPAVFGATSGMFGLLLSLVSIALSFFLVFFEWTATMRMSIYGRLSAGFQIGRLWSMIRHDFGGLLRILGMAILLALGLGILLSLFLFFVVSIGVLGGVAATAGSGHHPGVAGLGATAVLIIAILSIVFGLVSMVVGTFISMMVARALGYWTRQFDVPAWRGQDDPMPFEIARNTYTGGQPPVS